MFKIKSMFFIIFGILCIILFIMFYSLNHTSMPDTNVGPWYGRGHNLSKLPYSFIVGSIDPKSGIKGVIELGMTKSELHRSCGKPLISALSRNEALERSNNYNQSGDSLDISSFTNEFYGGVFAWVRYDKNGKIGLICFDLESFRKRFCGRQKLAISYNSNTFLIDENTQLKSLRHSLETANHLVNYDIISDNTLVIRGTYLKLVFDRNNMKLRYVSIVKNEMELM